MAEQAPESWPEGAPACRLPHLSQRHLCGPAGVLPGGTGPAHMMLAGVKTGPMHKVSVISQPQDSGLHMPSASSSCSAGSSCPLRASLQTRGGTGSSQHKVCISGTPDGPLAEDSGPPGPGPGGGGRERPAKPFSPLLPSPGRLAHKEKEPTFTDMPIIVPGTLLKIPNCMSPNPVRVTLSSLFTMRKLRLGSYLPKVISPECGRTRIQPSAHFKAHILQTRSLGLKNHLPPSKALQAVSPAHPCK